MANNEHRDSVDWLLKQERAEAAARKTSINEDDENQQFGAEATIGKVIKTGIGGLATIAGVCLAGAIIYSTYSRRAQPEIELPSAGISSEVSAAIERAEKRYSNKPSEIEMYASLPVTNVVARKGETMDGLILKHCQDFPRGAKQYVFMLENGNNGHLTAGKTYKVHVSTNISSKSL